MSDEQTPAPVPAPASAAEELEFRPFVKYAAMGLVGLVILGSGYATYALGYRSGFNAGIRSGLVSESLNDVAIRNLSHFLQCSTAGDSELIAHAADSDKFLAWIQDARVKKEAQWVLGCTLLDRNLGKEALPVLEKAFAGAPSDISWVRRGLKVAERLLDFGMPEEAGTWYSRAKEQAALVKAPWEQSYALEGQVHALLRARAAGKQTSAELNALIREAKQLGDIGNTARCIIMVNEGERLASIGKRAEAKRYMDATRELLPENVNELPAVALVCYGVACKATGDAAKAQELLTLGEKRLGHGMQDTISRLRALRYLSELAAANGDKSTAKSMLDKAEGIASGKVSLKEPFWNCLYLQRAWLQMDEGNKTAAKAGFMQAVNNSPLPEIAVQAMEGAASCCLDEGAADEALDLLDRCLTLRKKHFAEDTVSLGRVTLLKAHAVDHKGDAAQAVDLFADAANLLQGDAPEVVENHNMALLWKGHAQHKSEQWQACLETLEQVLPFLEDKRNLREEAEARIQDCRSRLQQPDPDFTSDFN